MECPGDVGGAPQVLAAAVHHVEAVLAQPQQESIFVKEKGSKNRIFNRKLQTVQASFIKAIYFLKMPPFLNIICCKFSPTWHQSREWPSSG